MKPTIRSLARMCGVSRGTVDRVLNDRPYVKPEVRQRVLRAVQQTGYVHPSARAQAGAHATHIGFLMAQWENAYFREQTARHPPRRAVSATGRTETDGGNHGQPVGNRIFTAHRPTA